MNCHKKELMCVTIRFIVDNIFNIADIKKERKIIMKKISFLVLCLATIVVLGLRQSVHAESASDALLEQKITESMNSLSLLHRNAQNKTLGYLKGSKISYSVGTGGSSPSYNLGILKYTGGSIQLDNIQTYLSADGKLSYYYDKNSKMFTIERKKNSPIEYKAEEASSQVSIDYQYQRWKAVVTIGGTSWIQDGQLKGTYTATVNGPINFTLETPPTITAETKEIFIGKNEDISTLDLNKYVNITQHMEGGKTSIEWVKKPNINTLGQQTAQIKIIDELDDYKQDKNFDIKVNVSEEKMSAESVQQTTTLGADVSKMDFSKFLKNVKLGDQLLSSDQYKVELINSLATDTVGTKTAKIRVTLNSDTSKIVEVDVPVEVGWGNSVVYGSYDYVANGRTSAAFTLYTESTPTIVASQGQNDDNLAIHSNFPNQQYYTFNWFDLSNKQILKIDESNNGDKYIKASGNELKKDKLKEWGTAQNQAVNYGDIVRAWQTETGKNWLYENEQKQAYNDAKKAVYYEITTSGYRPLHFNQLTPKTGKIPIYSTNKYLDEHVKDYIDLKGYSNIDVKEFVEYPDTASSGDKRAKILVEETLTTGKKVQYEYEVTINVEPGTLTYTVPKTLTFKEFSKSKSEQIVQRKYSGSLGLLIKDNRGSNKQGNWTLTAKASSDLKGIAPYLIYRNEKGVDSYLNGSAVPVYTQDKQVSATEPLEVEVSNKWKSTDGILLKVPSKNNLASQEYSTTITWNLVEGP
jgi:hypothetical protein